MSAVKTTRARFRLAIRGRVAVAVAVLAPACALGIATNRAGAIEPTPVTCGQVLTVSTLVANDLAECPEHGLVVGAPDIEIDLTGRTIDGVGLGAGVLNEGFDGVTISGGTVQEFDIGVHLAAGAGDTSVRAGRFVANQEAGVLLSAAAPGTEVIANEFVGNALAVGIIDGTSGVTVSDNLVSEGSGSGLEILGSNGNRIERNLFAAASDGGIVLEGASHNVLAANMVTGVSDAALLVTTESNGNRIQANVLSASDGGIIVDRSTGNVLLGNVAHGMSDVGIDLDSAGSTVVMGNDLRSNGEGIALFDSSNNRIEGNDTSESSGTAIAVEGASFGNAIVRNVADSSGATGISVISLADAGDGNLLDGNVTSRNPSGGISVTAPGHTLRRNVAVGNGGWGINAADGTIDGGGNFASGNGEQAQCVGVVCDGTLPPPVDVVPPETVIVDGPRNPTASRTATFAFEVVGEAGGEVALFECSLDGTAFVPCTSPHAFAGLELGDHALAVRATDVAGNVEPVPAVYGWSIVAAPDVDCGVAVTVIADADAWIDENSADANKGADSSLKVRSKGPADNFRALVRFPLPERPEGCVLDAATLRLYADSMAPGRQVQAARLAEDWSESTVTWANHPTTAGPAASTVAGEGWRGWAVRNLVEQMYDEDAAHGFLIRDAVESEDAEHGFSTRDSETPPQLVLGFVPRIDAPPPTTSTTTTTTEPPTTTTTTTEPPTTTSTTTTTEPPTTTTTTEPPTTTTTTEPPTTTTSTSTTTTSTTVPPTTTTTSTSTTTTTTTAPPTTTTTTTVPAQCTVSSISSPVVADAWIEQNSPRSNKGRDTTLKVKSQASSDNFRTLVRFSLPSALPDGCRLTSATLRLYATSWSNGRSLHAWRISAPWAELQVTWANQPGTAGTPSVTPSGRGNRNWNVTAHVATMLDTGVNHGFLVRDAVENGRGYEQSFAARELRSRPQLILQFGNE